MNPEIGRRYKRLLIFILILAVPVGVLLFFYRMYNDDIRAIKDFVAAYERFDQVVSDLSVGAGDDPEGNAGSAAADLASKASLRLSSLIKNDAGLMDQALEVADLARREIESLRAYRLGIKNENADVDELAEASRALTDRRKEAYARFQELGGGRR
jgi:hypothetical protein